MRRGQVYVWKGNERESSFGKVAQLSPGDHRFNPYPTMAFSELRDMYEIYNTKVKILGIEPKTQCL